MRDDSGQRAQKTVASTVASTVVSVGRRTVAVLAPAIQHHQPRVSISSLCPMRTRPSRAAPAPVSWGQPDGAMLTAHPAAGSAKTRRLDVPGGFRLRLVEDGERGSQLRDQLRLPNCVRGRPAAGGRPGSACGRARPRRPAARHGGRGSGEREQVKVTRARLLIGGRERAAIQGQSKVDWWEQSSTVCPS